MKIRILLVDDHSFIRRALKISLGDESALEIVGEAENGQFAIAQVESLQPDVVLMDIQMPLMDGVEATKQICDRFPDTKVLILTVDDTEDYVSQALKYGASGYILKNTSPEELYLGRKVIARVPEISEVSTTDWDKLTPREQQIVKLIATGANNEEIANQLYISTRTVKNHITNILSQLNLRNRTQIAILVASILNYS